MGDQSVSSRLSVKGMSKAFGATQALQKVDFDLRCGEIHGLLGENGAGKSTLIKILAGDYFADEGEIWFDGQKVTLNSPADSRRLGIRVIYQEFNLMPSLTVAENICLGTYPGGRIPGTISWPEIRRQAAEVLSRLGEKLPLELRVRDLSVAQQQVVEIAKALLLRPTVLIMDEPTSALNDQETENLFNLLRSLGHEGVSIIYISHRLDELFKLTDRVTVFRDGQYVGTVDTPSTTPGKLVKMMVGRDLREMYPKRSIPLGDTILEVKDLSVAGKVTNASFRARQGEIVAIFGLLGAGQTELARALFGAMPITSGEVLLRGKRANIKSTTSARAAGIGLVPDDRKGSGLVQALSVRSNMSLAALPRFATAGIVNSRVEDANARKWISELGVRCAGLGQQVRYLSGGNQQKVVIARWLANESKALILDQPTRGVDVGAKVDIYRLLEDLCEQGVAVVMFSLEMPEVLGIADTIYVMCQGEINGVFSRADATQERLMHYAVGCPEEEE